MTHVHSHTTNFYWDGKIYFPNKTAATKMYLVTPHCVIIKKKEEIPPPPPTPHPTIHLSKNMSVLSLYYTNWEWGRNELV